MGFDLDWVRRHCPGRNLVWLEQTTSTMLEAERLVEAGCPAGTVVGAEAQTAGRGRLGRNWHSQEGAGLYFTIVLKPDLALNLLPVITLALGLAVQEAVVSATGTTCDLKWPNDLMADGRKCAGILVEMQGRAVIAGIGVNVNQTTFPPELSSLATSLRVVTGKPQSREQLLVALLHSIDHYVGLISTEGREAVLRLYTLASSYVRGRRVAVEQENQTLTGTTDGLDEAGFLLLRAADGRRITIRAGGVRPV